MSVRTITVRLRSEVADFKRSMAEAAQSSDKMSARFDANGQKINTTAGRMVRSAEVNREAWTTAGTTLTAFGVAGVAAFGLAAKAAIDWESAFAGVIKTVDASADQILELEDGLRSLALQLPASSTEIADTAALLGQLGIQADSIVPLTKVMIDLGEATNLTAEEAATALARMANIMGSTTDDVARMGATIVDLGNNAATTEAEITNLALRMAAAGKQAGLSEADVFAFASALTSVGVEAEAGGTAMSKVITSIADATRTGNSDLATFAEVAGVSADEFRRAFEEDASTGIAMFVEGLGRMSNAGESTTAIFDELGLTDQRLMRAVLSLGAAQGLLTDQVELANGAFEDNTALIEEANKRYETTEARISIAKNAINEAAITVGETFLPVLADMADGVAGAAEAFSNLPPQVVSTTAAMGGVAAVTSLGAGAFLLLFPRVVETFKAMKELQSVSPAAARGLGATAKAATAAAVAYTGAVIAASAMPQLSLDTEVGASSAAQSLLDLANGADFADTAFASFTDHMALADLRIKGIGTSDWFDLNYINSVATAYDRLENTRFGENVADAFYSIIPGAAASRTEAEGLFTAIDTGLASLVQSGAIDEASASLWALAAQTGVTVSELRTQLPQYTDALAATEIQTEDTAAVTDDLSESTMAYNDLLTEQIDLQREAAGVALDEWDALTQYADALDSATQSLEDNGATLDVNTEAGRNNRDALATIAESTWAWVEAGDAAGVSSEELSTRMDEGRQAFIDAATQMGLTADEAEALADEMGLIPGSVNISVSTVGATAVLSTLDAIAARSAFINGNDVYVPVHTTSSGTTAYADGGAIRGPGTGTSDSILARVSNGEHVWTAAEVNAAGGHGAVEAMRMAALRGYATGGPVVTTPSATNVTVNPSLGDITAVMSDAQINQLANRFVEAASNLDHTAFASTARSLAGSSSTQGRLA